MRFMLRLRALFLLLFALAAWSSLKAQQAELRTINLLPDSGPLDIFVADTIQPLAVNLEYGSASPVFPGPQGQATMIVTPSSLHGQTLAATTISISQSYRNDLLLLGSAGNIDITSLPFISSFQPSPDSVYVRLFHSDPNFGAIDVMMTDNAGAARPLATTSYKGVTDFVRIPRGHLELKLFASGASTAFADVAGNLGGGSFVTVFLTGSGSSLRVQAFTENNPGPQQPMIFFSPVIAPPPDPFKLRLVNLVDSSGAAVLALDTVVAPATSPVAYRGASAVISRPMGTHLLKTSGGISATGITQAFSSDSAYTAFWIGTRGAHELFIASRPVSLSSVPPDSVRVRLFNAVSDDQADVMVLWDTLMDDRAEGNFGYRTLTNYGMIPAGRIILRISNNGETYQGTTTLSGGSTVTLVVSGAKGSGTVAANILRDDDSSEQAALPMLRAVPNAQFRVVNVASLDSATVYVNHNQNSKEAFHRFESSAILDEIPAVDYTLQVAPQDSPLSAATLDQVLSVNVDTLRSFVIMDGAGGAQFTSLTLNSTLADLPPTGKAALRWVNAAPGIGNVGLDLQFSDNTTTAIPLAVGASTPFSNVATGKFKVSVTNAGPAPIALLEGSLTEQDVVTAFVTGRTSSTIKIYLMHETMEEGEDPMLPLTVPVESAVSGSGADLSARLSIAPNPASAYLTVHVAGDLVGIRGSVVVTDLLGVAVKSIRFDEAALAGGALRIGVADLPAGSYALQLHGADGALRATSRFTVVR